MKARQIFKVALTVLAAAWLAGCAREEAQIEKLANGPKVYVGSEECKVCHLEHYDSWKMTLHSRTIQDVTWNQDAIITTINPEIIRADLKKLGDQLKLPVDEIYIPKIEDIKYTMGIQWTQRFLVEKNEKLYIAPVQYNIWNNTWIPYHENDWDAHTWNDRCGGCHSTGLDLEKNTFVEPAVGCEACHGPGSRHVALPKKAVFDKRLTIVNPSKLSAGIRTQICGGCHSAGKSTLVQEAYWPVGHVPGQALGPYFKSVSFADENLQSVYDDEVFDRHHQQYPEWQKSIHAQKGVSCTSCHYVHQLGVPPTQFQTLKSGSQQCLSCHTMVKNLYAHALHAFVNCIGCHMPRAAKSAETGDIINHTFTFMSPVETLKAGSNAKRPNACSSCHHHKDTPVEALAGFLEAAKKQDMPKPFSVHLRSGQSGK